MNLHGVSTTTLLFAVLAGVGFFVLIFSALTLEEKESLLDARLKGVGQGQAGGNVTAKGTIFRDSREQELAPSFTERFMAPLLAKVGASMGERAGPQKLKALEDKMASAGGYHNMSASTFMATQVVLAAALAIIALLLSLDLGLAPTDMLLFVIVLTILGYMLPSVDMGSKISARRKEILRALPTVLDLLTVSVEAGQSFDRAITNIVEKYDDAIAHEFQQVMNAVNLGHPRAEALRAMESRVGVEDLSAFIHVVLQSEQMGTTLAPILRIQSEEIWRKRRERAQSAGAQAPVKMLIPMVCCIFPSIFVVLLGPAGLTIMKSMSS